MKIIKKSLNKQRVRIQRELFFTPARLLMMDFAKKNGDKLIMVESEKFKPWDDEGEGEGAQAWTNDYSCYPAAAPASGLA